ncbi:DMT family transporter [Bacillus sp. JJ722]|uniref:DMT family transporter n=1 Tax=Bacillus sp. JJ722 TaxID=3122973 RepID=UPI002FFEEF73
MNPFVVLIFAIVAEVFGSSMLKVSNGFKRLWPSIGVVIAMGTAFYFLSIALKYLPLGTAYAIWSGLGTALTALIGVLVWKEKISAKKLVGLIFIIGGVVVMKLSSGSH